MSRFLILFLVGINTVKSTEQISVPKNCIDNLPNDLLQISEAYLTPNESLTWKQTNKKNKRLTITGLYNIFENDGNIRVSRNVQNQDDIQWFDPQNLISDNGKNALRNCLRLPEYERSNCIFDEVAEYHENNSHQYHFKMKILFKMLGKLDDDERKKACRFNIFETASNGIKGARGWKKQAVEDMEKFVQILKKENKLDESFGGESYARTLTPLTLAAAFGNRKTIEIILDANADIDAVSPFGDTALMQAASMNNLENLEFLLQKNASIDKTGEDEYTALMWAAVSPLRNIGVVNALLERNAKIDVKNKEGYTAAQLAKRSGFEEKERIINNFANTKCKNQDKN